MSALDDRLDDLVKAVVAPTLKPLGYAKRKLTWVRSCDDAVHSITLQRSHGNSVDHLRFYVEIGSYVPEFARAIGNAVPDDRTKAIPQYLRRFETVCDWPDQWIDLEAWDDDELHPAFEEALVRLDEHLTPLVDAEQLVVALRDSSTGLDLDLFAWWCATEKPAGMADQIATARSRFGHEERWPLLYTQFERVAQRFEIAIPEASA